MRFRYQIRKVSIEEMRMRLENLRLRISASKADWSSERDWDWDDLIPWRALNRGICDRDRDRVRRIQTSSDRRFQKLRRRRWIRIRWWRWLNLDYRLELWKQISRASALETLTLAFSATFFAWDLNLKFEKEKRRGLFLLSSKGSKCHALMHTTV